MAGLGDTGLGIVLSGMADRCSTLLVMARQAWSWVVGSCADRQGQAEQGKARQAVRVMVRWCSAGHGKAAQGKAGEACPGRARLLTSTVRQGRHVRDRRDVVMQCRAWQGMARHSKAGRDR